MNRYLCVIGGMPGKHILEECELCAHIRIAEVHSNLIGYEVKKIPYYACVKCEDVFRRAPEIAQWVKRIVEKLSENGRKVAKK